MAIGLSCLFGVKLPLNFNSPYKAVNIIDFWRRWHMTLSRFLRDYLYFSLGGNRKGPGRRYVNLLITMLLGGLWHGAGWTFVCWGGLHGMFLVVNHLWHRVRDAIGYPAGDPSRAGRVIGMTITFIAVVLAWVFFRANDLDTALRIVGAMIGLNGIELPNDLRPFFPSLLMQALAEIGIGFGNLPTIPDFGTLVAWIVTLWAMVWLAPNSQQILAAQRPALEQIAYAGALRWRPNAAWLACVTIGLLYAVIELGGKVSEFLYFQF